MGFDDGFFAVPIIREGTIPANNTNIVQHSSYSGAPDNIYLKDTYFNPDFEYDPVETPRHEQIVVLDNNNKTLMSL